MITEFDPCKKITIYSVFYFFFILINKSLKSFIQYKIFFFFIFL